MLKPEDFYRDAHRLVFEAIVDLFRSEKAADLITVTERLKMGGNLERAGGIAFVTSLANAVPTAANILYHANIVKEKALLRSLINAATEIAGSAYEETEAVDVVLDDAEKKILAVTSHETDSGFVPIKELVLKVVDQIEERSVQKNALTGIASGFADLDRLTSGFQPSDLILVAARPSMGKTAFVLNIATHAAIKLKKPVAFFSLEMSNGQLVQRMLSSEGAVDSQNLRSGNLTEEEWHRIMIAGNRLVQAPLYINDTPGITVMELRSKARRLKAEHDLALIIIDYLQLMQGRGAKNNDNRQQEISEISRSLKALARELSVPVIALSQLSRNVEMRQSKRPMLSDLRESGSLEQDADIVMFLYRDDYYKPDSEEQNLTEVIIAKHRNGPVDKLRLYFEKRFTKFTGWERERTEQTE